MRPLAGLLLLWAGCVLGQARTPAETVDAFHAALRSKDTAGALSLLDRGLVVFEFGSADPTAEAYAFRHLPFDMDVAVATRWKLETRRPGARAASAGCSAPTASAARPPTARPSI
jgi:hypothetical protein